MKLTKHHGLGNDFLIALEIANDGLVPSADVARALCDRRTGVGADGLIFGMSSTSDGVDVEMILYNSDGSIAELSGNGLRCLAQAYLIASAQTEGVVVARTAAGLRPMLARREADASAVGWGGSIEVEVGMGTAGGGPQLNESARRELDRPGMTGRVATVDMGNPHIVFENTDVDMIDLADRGRAIESTFEAGINVHFVQIDGPETIRLRVWERGAGITEACGSGACAAAVAAHEWGLVGASVQVEMPGGKASVRLSDEGVTLIGPATFIAKIEIA